MIFIQMRMAQPLPIAQAKDAMTYSAQVMRILFPLLMVGITIFFAWQFAAGIALYQFVWIGLNMVQQYFVSGWGSLVDTSSGLYAGGSCTYSIQARCPTSL